jgi:hypothetical protein
MSSKSSCEFLMECILLWKGNEIVLSQLKVAVNNVMQCNVVVEYSMAWRKYNKAIRNVVVFIKANILVKVK